MMDMLILLAVFIAILALAYFTYRNLVGLDGRIRKIENILQNAEVVTTTDPLAMPSAQNHVQHQHQHQTQGNGQDYSAFVSPEYIAGWGGQGPVLTVQKEGDEDEDGDDEEKVVELINEEPESDIDNLEEAEEIDDAESGSDDVDGAMDKEEERDQVLDLDLGEDTKKVSRVERVEQVDTEKDVMNSVDDILKSMENDSRRRQNEASGNESVSRGPKVSDMKDALKKAGVSFPATAKKSELQRLMEEHHIQV